MEKSQIQTLPGIDDLNTNFTYLYNHSTFLLHSHSCQTKWVSPDVYNTDKYSHMLNKLPLSLKSCYTGSHTSKQTLCHTQVDAWVFGHATWTHVYKHRNTHVSTKLCSNCSDTYIRFLSLMWTFLGDRDLGLLPSALCLKLLKKPKKERKKNTFFLPAAVSISCFMWSYFLYWITMRLSFALSLNFNQPAFFPQKFSAITVDIRSHPFLSVCVHLSWFQSYIILPDSIWWRQW